MTHTLTLHYPPGALPGAPVSAQCSCSQWDVRGVSRDQTLRSFGEHLETESGPGAKADWEAEIILMRRAWGRFESDQTQEMEDAEFEAEVEELLRLPVYGARS